jgi:phosphotriesterase-related protein
MTKIRTVLGDISQNEFGLALVHEHVICDFIGADKVSRDRYDSKEVFDVMLPYLTEIRQLGVTGFVDCTPAFIGRDAELLADISRVTGIHILTNTGLYKEPFLPNYALEYSIDQLANMWKYEIEEGIEELPIKAGFIKIAVNPGHIIPIQQKIVRAAARCSLSTNAVIACHTASGVAAMDLLEVLGEEGVDPSRVVVAHCDAEEDWKYHLEILQQGAWVEYDLISEANSGKTLRLINLIAGNDFEAQLLLSQDAGWYTVGENRGGNIRSYTYLVKDFVPLMTKSGFSRNFIDKVLIENPARAFQIK